MHFVLSKSDEERFWKKVIPEPNTGCWLWTGHSNRKGYGWFSAGKLRLKAHRVAWILFHGPIPEGMQVLHRCDNPWCVNAVRDLFLGSNLDNRRDSVSKGRPARGEKHWKAKLTVEIVRAIREASGTQLQMAHRFGVGQKTISYIRNFKAWRHV